MIIIIQVFNHAFALKNSFLNLIILLKIVILVNE